MTGQWTFVIAAYALVIAGAGIVSLLAWRAMRRAEK